LKEKEARMNGKKSLKTATVAALAALVSLTLSGCTLLYPHWGATGLPSDSASASASMPEPSNSASTTATASASASPTTVPVQPATLHIIQSNVDSTIGVIDVVAEVTNVTEDGGRCTLSITAGASTKTQTVKAESNVDGTQCFPMEITLTGLPKGPATFKVSYSSTGYSGSTGPQAVTIQ
jgi:hypothetical protein